MSVRQTTKLSKIERSNKRLQIENESWKKARIAFIEDQVRFFDAPPPLTPIYDNSSTSCSVGLSARLTFLAMDPTVQAPGPPVWQFVFLLRFEFLVVGPTCPVQVQLLLGSGSVLILFFFCFPFCDDRLLIFFPIGSF